MSKAQPLSDNNCPDCGGIIPAPGTAEERNCQHCGWRAIKV